MKKNPSMKILLFLGYMVIYIPLAIIVFYSFNSSRSMMVWTGFSMDWYKSMLYNKQLHNALLNSVCIAFCSATISVVLGTIIALLITRLLRPAKRFFLNLLITSSMVTPDIVVAISFAMMFSFLYKMTGWPETESMTPIVITHAVITISYTTIMIQSKLADIDYSLIEAALNLGVTPVRSFFVVTLPLISRTLFFVWLVAFMLSIDDVVVSNFISGPDTATLQLLIFSSIRAGISPEINAFSTVLLLSLAGTAGIAALVSNRIHKRRNEL